MLNWFKVEQQLQVAKVEGAALVQGVIRNGSLADVQEELSHIRFGQSQDTALVKQQYTYAAFRETIPNTFVVLERLRRQTELLVRSARKSFPQLATWQAYDTMVHKYSSTDFLGAHRDLERHPQVIAIYTVTGECKFELLTSHDGEVTKVFYPTPGDLLLLRAPGLSGCAEDDRPVHRVSGNMLPGRHRISVTFRGNLRPNKPIPGIVFQNWKSANC